MLLGCWVTLNVEPLTGSGFQPRNACPQREDDMVTDRDLKV